MRLLATDVEAGQTGAKTRQMHSALGLFANLPIVVDIQAVEWLPLPHHEIRCNIKPEMVWTFDPMVCHKARLKVLGRDTLAANQASTIQEVVG